MAVNCDLINSYANQFLPQFQFADTERIFPVSIESWLTQCSQGDWTSASDPHRGTAVVEAQLPLTINDLIPFAGCQGISGSPIDPSQPLQTSDSLRDESFIDFAGWQSLAISGDFSEGNNTYIREYFSPYFKLFNSGLAMPLPLTRTPPSLPKKVAVFCEAAWCGDFTRLSITENLFDFATPPSTNGTDLTPDTALDPFFVLTYYLFYPCTEPPPNSNTLSPVSSDQLFREGQWEAVSLYFKSTGGSVSSALDLQLSATPSQVTPDFAVLSNGIIASGDGQSKAMGNNFPANVGSWSKGGQIVIGGGILGGKELVQQPVFVTSGTHKNLFSPTPTTTTTSPDQGWTAVGGVLEGAGGAALPAWPVGTILGGLAMLAGFLMQLFGKDSSTSSPPDSSGDTASSNGPAAGVDPGSSSAPVVAVDLTVISTLPNNTNCVPPAWWSYPGRWGVPIVPVGSPTWDGGSRRIDFMGRSRAYWNTVWLQQALHS